MSSWRKNSALVLALSLAVLVAGCASTEPQEDQDQGMAQVDDRGSAAGTTGLPDDRRFRGHPLDDPDGALYKKVVYFDFDSAEIQPEDRATIEAHAGYLAGHPSARISLEGHCDERGTREYNVALGERRANAVRRLMELLRASGSQIETISYGEERPAALGHYESAWRLNRRVVIEYQVR